MDKHVLSPEESAELIRLNTELLPAQQRVTATFQTRGRPLKGPELARFMDEESNISAITRRIRELRGG